MNTTQYQKDLKDFSDYPLASLFFGYIDVLKSHNFHKEAEDLLAISEQYYLPENCKIIRNIIIAMQRATVSDEKNKFEQYLQQLQN